MFKADSGYRSGLLCGTSLKLLYQTPGFWWSADKGNSFISPPSPFPVFTFNQRSIMWFDLLHRWAKAINLKQSNSKQFSLFAHNYTTDIRFDGRIESGSSNNFLHVPLNSEAEDDNQLYMTIELLPHCTVHFDIPIQIKNSIFSRTKYRDSENALFIRYGLTKPLAIFLFISRSDGKLWVSVLKLHNEMRAC